MGLNLFVLCIGLIICFGGIYLRKLVAGMMGFAWGLFLGFVIVVLRAISAGGFWALRYGFEEGSMIILVIIALVVCLLSVALDKLCAAINAFLSSFITIFLIAIIFVADMDSLAGIVCIALLAASVIAIMAYIYYNYAFIIVTAFSGAYIASIGGLGLFTGYELSEMLYILFGQGSREVFGMIALGTLILGCLGCYVQMKRLNGSSGSKADSDMGQEDAPEAEDQGNINLEQVNAAAGKVAEGAMNAGRTVSKAAAPVFRDMGVQMKDAWDEIHTEYGRRDFKQTILSNKFLLIAPLIDVVLLPFLYRMLPFMIYGEILNKFVYWIAIFAGASSLGVLVYITMIQDVKLNIIYQLLYAVGYLVFNFTNLKYYSGWEIFVDTLQYLLIWCVLFFEVRLIQKNSIKPLVLTVTAWFMRMYVISGLGYFYFSIYIGSYHIAWLVIAIGTVFLLFKKLHNINVFSYGIR